ncbi:MAG: DUF452 family protein [Muribaculaceae bacterium]|nr:DUF452 family protein [Muribaculaceae bacterium]
MKLQYLSDSRSQRLLLIFAGWSTDAAAFDGLSAPGYDIAVLSDYSSLSLPPLARDYDEVVVLAWSLGVWAASVVIPHSGLPVTLAVAVNGTPWPVSDTFGIPVAVFDATAAGLTAASLAKFRRRMGGTSVPLPTSRTVESLAAELVAVSAASQADPVAGADWDRAIVSDRDLIFPPAAQMAAWEGNRTVVDGIGGAHTPPSWQEIVDRYIIDKTLVKSRFERGQATYADEAGVQQRAADHLWSLWRKYGNNPRSVLEIGSGDGTLTRLYRPQLKSAEIILWDIADSPGVTAVCDAETAGMALPAESLAVIASAHTIQWFNSPARFLSHASRALRSGGLLVLSTFGPATFSQLTEAGVIPLPYLSIGQWRASVPADMELLELHDGLITKLFATPLDVIRHLRATGVNARPSRVPLPEVLRQYPREADGRAALTYNPIYLILKKK